MAGEETIEELAAAYIAAEKALDEAEKALDHQRGIVHSAGELLKGTFDELRRRVPPGVSIVLPNKQVLTRAPLNRGEAFYVTTAFDGSTT